MPTEREGGDGGQSDGLMGGFDWLCTEFWLGVFIGVCVGWMCATFVAPAHGRDLDGRYAQSPTIAVLATICLDRCQDVVVTTSEQDSRVTMMWCAIGGQIAIAEWLAQNKPGYRLAGWKCVVGDKRRGA